MESDPIYPEEADFLRALVRLDSVSREGRRVTAKNLLVIPLNIAERLAQLGYLTESGRASFPRDLTDKARKEFGDAE